ncbi:MAG: hypothetical protein ACRDFX_03885, partial [Chloroflexota bacterium]
IVARPDADLPFYLPVLARVHLSMGDVPTAGNLADDGVRDATGQGEQLYLVDALLVQAMTRNAAQLYPEALAIADRGIGLAHGMPYPLAEARLLAVAADSLKSVGGVAAARQRLEEALAICRHLGALHEVAQMESALSELHSKEAVAEY